MEISEFACEEKIRALLRVCALLPGALRGRLFPELYIEAALKIWLVAQTVFKFRQNLTSFAHTVEKSGTL